LRFPVAFRVADDPQSLRATHRRSFSVDFAGGENLTEFRECDFLKLCHPAEAGVF
jgi:hypothetical protein